MSSASFADFGVAHSKWKSVAFEMRLTATGGLLARQHESVPSKVHAPTNTHYIKLTKSEPWLQRMVAGCKSNHALNETTLLEELMQKVTGGDCSVGHEDTPDDEDTLIASLDYDEPVVTKPAAKRARIKPSSIITVTMPNVCPTARDRGDGSTRTVTLWYFGSRVVWLAQHDVEWAVSYMRCQLDTYGVPPLDDSQDTSDIPDGDTPSEPAIRWDHGIWGWKVGNLIIKPCNVTIQDTGLDAASFDSLTYAQKKELAYKKACSLIHV